MKGVDTRNVSRDSLFLLANIKVEQDDEQHRVRVRNLSDGGMMGEGPVKVQRGNRVEVELRNVGSVDGSIAWVQDRRFGVAFDEEIDAQFARAPAQKVERDVIEHHSMSRAHRAPPPPEPSQLRKV